MPHPSERVAQAPAVRPPGLAALLRARRHEIVAEWTHHVGRLPHARDLEHPRLRDEVPSLLARIADHIEAGGHPDGHALDRLDVGFDLGEITLEYAELRRCILRALARDGRGEGDIEERIRLHECIDHAAHAAAVIGQQRAQAALRRGEQALRDAIHGHDEALHTVSHDLKNPLGVIVLNAALVARLAPAAGGERERLTKAAEATRRAAGRMRRLIDDLLQVSAIDAGRLAIDPAPIDLRAVAGAALETMGPLAESRSLALDLPAEEARVMADRPRILQVLEHLLTNAFQRTPEGGRVTVRIALGEEPGRATCEVTDSGPGIPPERLPRLFERDWTGLYIARGIVEGHGGRIGAGSTERGSTLRFTLPLAG